MEIVTGILGAFFGGLSQLLGMGQQRQAQVANDAEKEILRQELARYQQAMKEMEEKLKQQQQMMLFGIIGVVVVVVIIMMVARR
jgi:uncharacterized membrane protein YeaQ/YmgE (transglycosylase-associated protein family)